MDSTSFFNELTAAIDAGVSADQLEGILEHDALRGPCASWREAPKRCWEAWKIAQKLAEAAYDLAAKAREEEDGSSDTAR